MQIPSFASEPPAPPAAPASASRRDADTARSNGQGEPTFDAAMAAAERRRTDQRRDDATVRRSDARPDDTPNDRADGPAATRSSADAAEAPPTDASDADGLTTAAAAVAATPAVAAAVAAITAASARLASSAEPGTPGLTVARLVASTMAHLPETLADGAPTASAQPTGTAPSIPAPPTASAAQPAAAPETATGTPTIPAVPELVTSAPTGPPAPTAGTGTTPTLPETPATGTGETPTPVAPTGAATGTDAESISDPTDGLLGAPAVTTEGGTEDAVETAPSTHPRPSGIPDHAAAAERARTVTSAPLPPGLADRPDAALSAPSAVAATPTSIPTSPTVSSAPVAPTTPVPAPQVVDLLAEAARHLRRSGDNAWHMTIRLDPPELGQVRLELTARGDGIHLAMSTDSQGGAGALEQQRQAIARMLEEAGFSLDGFDVASQQQDRGRGDSPATDGDAARLLGDLDAELEGLVAADDEVIRL